MRVRPIADLVLAILAAPLVAQISSVGSQSDEIQSMISAKQLEAAEKTIVERLVTDPNNAQLIIYLAEIRLDQRRPQETLRLVENAERISGATALTSQIAGLAESAENHLTAAEERFRRAIELDPELVPAHYFLARVLYTRNQFDEAIQENKAAISLSPDFVRAYENLGLCYEGKDDAKNAEEWYREAIRRNSASPEKSEWPDLDLAVLLIKQERIDEAREYLAQALKLNRNNAQSHFQMGILLEKAGDLQNSLEELRTALKLDARLSGAAYRAAWVCRKLGKKTEAQHYFDEYKQLTERKR